MTGRAYNPKGYDPEVKGRFSALAPEVTNAFAESWAKELSSMREHIPYEEAMKYLKRGEGATLGHYVTRCCMTFTPVSRIVCWKEPGILICISIPIMFLVVLT